MTDKPEIPAIDANEDIIPAHKEKEVIEREVVDIKIPVSKTEEFDWNVSKRGANQYSKEKIAELETLYDQTFKQVEDNEIVKAIVTGITDADVILNIGFKSDGMISKSEFKDTPDLKIGDEVDVYVENKENKKGQLILSRKKAKLTKAWDYICEANAKDIVVKGRVISKTKGGLIVDLYGMETFLPGSQIDVKPITDYDQFVGKTMEFKVVKINETIKNAVVSHKALIESDLESQRQEIIGKLEKGQVLEGTIKNITDFGAFIDLGGVDGLLYITDISWGRINHPNEVLKMDQKLQVVVIDYDDNKKRISLGLKQLQAHPWDSLPEGIEVGAKVKGKIVNIEDYGSFLEIVPGVEGLIHVSEVTWSNQPINSRDFFKLGDEFEAVVVTLDKDERKMSLSLKQMQEDPWKHIAEKYPVGSKMKGLVKNITPYGVFVELDDVVGGMIHISDLSWTKRYNHPSEFTKVGNELDVVVLEIDVENKKIVLGHKQLEEDPWDTFESLFPISSVHEATVLKREDKGAVVQLPYGIEAFAPTRHIKKEDGKLAEVEEVLPFKVLEFDRDDKRIIVSHTRVNEDVKLEEKKSVDNEKKAAAKKTKDAVEKSNSKIEKSTLGDISALSDLKSKMENE
ncbi:MAG TPA: 30S ribosomal protein S1 [Chitinophagales bacterium]|nr:30S ribosomal protein S1 [Chitinophagales bacterium]HMW12685.1 30S ribosomal protein S1 [Chitinophagales bacterium]HMX60266.1 30S ribosomal protein S1 [Chitinophagales bacterium]HMY23026.1 30S ribosomal protein S1 [Chitinophagales bacterium]HMZ34397.1 30S ribosomal protein S1 [Chitinophagales bacterium]